MCVANPAVPPGSAHGAIFNAPAHTALSGAWWELKLRRHCYFVKAPPGRPLSSVCSEAIWCWVCPVLSPELQMSPSAAGKAQLTGSTFTVLWVLCWSWVRLPSLAACSSSASTTLWRTQPCREDWDSASLWATIWAEGLLWGVLALSRQLASAAILARVLL